MTSFGNNQIATNERDLCDFMTNKIPQICVRTQNSNTNERFCDIIAHRDKYINHIKRFMVELIKLRCLEKNLIEKMHALDISYFTSELEKLRQKQINVINIINFARAKVSLDVKKIDEKYME